MKKHILSFAFIATMIASIVTGCSSTEKATSGADTTIVDSTTVVDTTKIIDTVKKDTIK